MLIAPILAQAPVKVLSSNPKDREYRIALILPFKSQRTRTKLTEVMLDYYEGFRLGLEHVSLEGLKCKLYVFDNAKDSANIDNILRHPDLPKMNIIVGPVYDEDLNKMSRFCDSTGQLLVNPLRYYENGHNKGVVLNFFPSDEIQIESIVQSMTGKYPNHVFYIAKDLTDESSNYAKTSREALKSSKVKIGNDLLLSNGKLEGKIWRSDSVIILSASRSEEMLKVLNETLKEKPNSLGIAHFEAHKKTKKFEKRETIVFPDLYYYNKSDSASKRFYRAFKEEHLGAPSKYAGIGYDQAIYLAYSLMAYGDDFLTLLPGATYQGIRNKIYLQPDSKGNISNFGMYYYKHHSGFKSLIE